MMMMMMMVNHDDDGSSPSILAQFNTDQLLESQESFEGLLHKASTVEAHNSVPQNSGKSHNRGQNMNDQLFM